MPGMPASVAESSGNRGSGPCAPLARVVYRSRAVQPMPGGALLALAQAAQARNRTEAVTGLVLYDRGSFFQWLEGPPGGVERLMRSINQDGRHTDIRVLSHQVAGARTFADWNMRLAGRGLRGVPPGEIVEPAREAIEVLRKSPEGAPTLLASLAPAGGMAAGAARRGQPSRAHVLQEVFLARVVPELAARRPAVPQAHPHAAAFAGRLLAFDAEAALDVALGALPPRASPVVLFGPLFEAAARIMGDRSDADACSALDVTLGLCCLRLVLRRLCEQAAPPGGAALCHASVLLAAQPGERDALGPALHAETLWQAGIAARVEYPGDEACLLSLLAADHFDCLDFSLSAATMRDASCAAAAATIAQARRASCNPHIAILANGRPVAADRAAARRMGADEAIDTAARAPAAVRRLLNARH